MATLDSSVTNVALPFIAGSLSASMDESTSIMSSFMVANAIAMPLAGWLAAVVGRKRYYTAGVLIFTVSAALCGLAPSLGWLIAFRVLQGIGGGGLWPTEQGILLDAFPPPKLWMAMGLQTMSVLVGLIAGPIVGGWIIDNCSWRWIFYINIPIGCLSLFLAQRFLEDPPHLVAARAAQRGKSLRIDLVGIALIVLSLGTLPVVFDRGQEFNWFGSPLIVWLTSFGLVTLIGAIIWELRHPEPLLHLRLLKDRNFLCCSLVSVVTASTVYGSTMCLPEMLETLVGYTPIEAGMALSPGALVSMVKMPIVPATAERLQQMAQVAKDAGFDAVTAGEKGLGLLGRLAEGQAMSLAYFDMYWMFGLGCLAVLPAVFLIRRSVADRTNSVKH